MIIPLISIASMTNYLKSAKDIKKLIIKYHFLLVNSFILSLLATSASSESYKIEPFALYEQA